jgi:hypothetical protein
MHAIQPPRKPTCSHAFAPDLWATHHTLRAQMASTPCNRPILNATTATLSLFVSLSTPQKLCGALSSAWLNPFRSPPSQAPSPLGLGSGPLIPRFSDILGLLFEEMTSREPFMGRTRAFLSSSIAIVDTPYPPCPWLSLCSHLLCPPEFSVYAS